MAYVMEAGLGGAAYRASSSIQVDINERKGWLASLESLYNAATSTFKISCNLHSSYATAGLLVAQAGSIFGKPFDNGKLGGESEIYREISNSAAGLLLQIRKAMKEVEDELEDLQIELTSALAYEERNRYKAPKSEKNPPSSYSGRGGGGCFIKGTKVVTNKGYIDIDKIKINTKVLSFNEKTREKEYKKVLKKFVHKNVEEILYKFIGDDFVVEATSQHRFYTKTEVEYRWTKAEEIYVGYILLDSNMKHCEIKEIETKKIKENIYNLEIDENHNYYVTENEILVHNIKDDIAYAYYGANTNLM